MTPVCIYTGVTPVKAPLPWLASYVIVTASFSVGNTGDVVICAANVNVKSSKPNEKKIFILLNEMVNKKNERRLNY